jgi:hypothetical protein
VYQRVVGRLKWERVAGLRLGRSLCALSFLAMQVRRQPAEVAGGFVRAVAARQEEVVRLAGGTTDRTLKQLARQLRGLPGGETLGKAVVDAASGDFERALAQQEVSGREEDKAQALRLVERYATAPKRYRSADGARRVLWFVLQADRRLAERFCVEQCDLLSERLGWAARWRASVFFWLLWNVVQSSRAVAEQAVRGVRLDLGGQWSFASGAWAGTPEERERQEKCLMWVIASCGLAEFLGESPTGICVGRERRSWALGLLGGKHAPSVLVCLFRGLLRLLPNDGGEVGRTWAAARTGVIQSAASFGGRQVVADWVRELDGRCGG